MSVLFIHSHFGMTPAAYADDPRISVRRERDLSSADFDQVNGVITTTHLDQIGWLDHMPAVTRLLDRGGNWFFNGHVLRSFLPELGVYEPLEKPKRADLVLTRLFDHPVFGEIEQRSLEENRGVAGFYGRGYNPLPAGAVAINGIGPGLKPIDWVWERPGGGRLFSHAGNDLGGLQKGGPLIARIIAWTNGEL